VSHAASTENPYTRGIAEFVSSLKYEAIPDEVRHRIKLLMLDSLGCALFPYPHSAFIIHHSSFIIRP